MGDVVDVQWGADQLLAHVFTHLHVNFPRGQGATVGYWPLETHDRANDVDERSKGPGIGSTILNSEGMRDLNGADDGAVWQAHLVWRVSQRAQQRMLGLVRGGLRACVEHVPPWLHPKVTVLDALLADQDGLGQPSSSERDAAVPDLSYSPLRARSAVAEIEELIFNLSHLPFSWGTCFERITVGGAENA